MRQSEVARAEGHVGPDGRGDEAIAWLLEHHTDGLPRRNKILADSAPR
jgi:hypothetical protein